MGYLHGIQIKESAKNVVMSVGDTSVIALVGTASKGTVGEARLITSLESAVEEYGDDISGFTIPSALSTIFSSASAKVIVVNVLTNEKATALIEDGKMTRDESGYVATNIYKSTLPEAVDYSADIVKGVESLLTLGDTIGLTPNIIISPGYSQLEAVMSKMTEVADKLEAFAVIDMVADDVQAALTARASGIYNITSQAAVLCYPQTLRNNMHEGTIDTLGLSVHWALSKALRDGKEGYHLSPSNTELSGIVGLTASVTSSLTDESADTNLLNAQGITTVFRKSGKGTRLWGNWTAAFPSDKTTVSMVAPRAVRMAIRTALVDAALNYMDRTATGITVEMTTNDVNAFLRSLIGKGAIVDGRCTWDADKNSALDIAQGKLTFTLSVKYAPSLELITFDEVVEL